MLWATITRPMGLPGPPQMSPDGAYWWDGQKWQPMPGRAVPPPVPTPAAQQDARPSWLADTAPRPDDVVVPPDDTPPLWAQPVKPSPIRTVSMVAAGVAIAVMLGWAGTTLWEQNLDNQRAASASQALTAQLSWQQCPVIHPGETSCWKGSLLNTGPTIWKLAITFVTSPPYTDWFARHGNPTLSSLYTSPGCELDSPHARIVCGSLTPHATLNVYLIGDVTTAGTFNYGLTFSDISLNPPVYVNQRPDGTHEIVSWIESPS